MFFFFLSDVFNLKRKFSLLLKAMKNYSVLVLEMVRAICCVYKGILVACHDMSFCFLLYFLKVSSILDTQVSVLFRTLVHSLPLKWRRVAQPKVALRRYRDYFHLMILVS